MLLAALRTDPEYGEDVQVLLSEYQELSASAQLLCADSGVDYDKLSSQSREKIVQAADRVESGKPPRLELPVIPSMMMRSPGAAPRAALDFEFWCLAIKIKYRAGFREDQSPDEREGPVLLSEAQKALVAYLISGGEVGPVRGMVLKSRQLGFTTILLLFWLWKMLHTPRFCVLFIIDTQSHSSEKRNFIIDWAEHSHRAFGTPKITSRAGKSLLFANRSRIDLDYSGAPNLGTGSHIDAIHTSEEPKWLRPELADQVKMSMFPTIADVKGTYIIRESTAKGKEAFYRSWVENEGKKGPGSYRRIFVPWHASKEYKVQVEEDFDYSSSERYFDYNSGEEPLSEREYAERYSLTPEQILFRRRKIDFYEGDISSFDQEYPTTSLHAFSSSDTTYLPEDVLDSFQVRPPIFRGTPSVSGIKKSETGECRIYELPDEEFRFVAGLDSAEGLTPMPGQDPDSTYMVVLRSDGVLAACMNTRRQPEECWEEFFYLASYFKAWVNMEVPKADVFKVKFMERRYPYMCVQPEPAFRDWRERIGTRVTPGNRGILLDNFRAFVRESSRKGLAPFPDEDLQKEAANLIRYPNGKIKARAGFHDDGMFGYVHGVEALRIAPPLPEKKKVEIPVPTEGLSLGDLFSNRKKYEKTYR